MKQIRIGISSIGSGVGQSVINSCNLSSLPLYTIGLGTNPLAYGLYECDDYAFTKSFYDADYIDNIIQHCLAKKVDIFFPGHDDDAHIVSKNIEIFEKNNILVVVSSKELLDLCRDKEKMSNVLNEISPIFVKSFDKDGFIKAYEDRQITLPVISKPSDGYASKGIRIIAEEDDFERISDNDVIQELAIPHKGDPQRAYVDRSISKKINPQVAEVSIQIVAGKDGEIIGKMISYNKLNNGVPIEIIPIESDLVWKELDKFIPTFKKLGLKGPFNLQGRITDNGLKLFEMNARFTGITGLRAYMGFNEVEACIKEWLGIRSKDEVLEINLNSFGIRQTADKAISLEWNKKVKDLSIKLNGGSLKTKKNILITGSTGFIGQNLIRELHANYAGIYDIWAFTRDKSKANVTLPYENIQFFDYNDFKDGNLSIGNVDILLHLGFARPHCSNSEIAASLKFTNELFAKAVKNQVGTIINISSQSIYGQSTTPLWTEETLAAPEMPYSQAKFSTELLLESLLNFNPHLCATSLRLAAVTGGQAGAVIQDLPSKLVNQLLQGNDLNIQGGDQKLEFIDIRDVITAITSLLSTNPKEWDIYYNLGINQVYTLRDIANITLDRFNNRLEKQSKMIISESNTHLKFGMDSSSFMKLTNWQPQYKLEDMVDSLIDYHLKTK
ncbi:NAD-dependent epimerase/dehydratase family protein [Flavobacteriaceae bacterium Ap0902]|nr:NAD-dependent epimerase/dehydratase family protein [Flavobacteriaceae bacterium Ap0902]